MGWNINNKQVKSWTIGGKEVKFITFPNGKVLNFAPTTPQEIITIKTTDYDRLAEGHVKINDLDLSSQTYLRIVGLSDEIYNSLKPKFPPEYGSVPFIINYKQNDIVLRFPLNNNEKFVFSKDEYTLTDTLNKPSIFVNNNLNNFVLINGHAYKFNGTAQIEDLGPFVETAPEKLITITNSQYTAIDESYKDTYGYALTGYTLTDTTTNFNKLILDVRENLTIPKSTKFYDDGYSNTIFVLNSIQSDTFNLIAGHKYSFEDTKDPVDLGEYGTTTPSIKTITANMYSSAVISSHYNIAISFTDTSVWDALHPGAVTTTLLPEKIIFEVKEEIEVLPYVYFTLIDITTHKGFNVNYSGNGFTLKAGHKYQFENGKEPVDLGTYDTAGGTTPGATLQDAIDALTWTGITAHLPSDGTLAANQLTYNDLVGAPTLPTGSSIQSITHNSAYDAGDLSVQINFIKGEDWATKTITVNVIIAAYVPKTFTFDSSNYSTITYGKKTGVSGINNEMILNNSTSNDNIVSKDTIILYCDTSGSLGAPSYDPSIYIHYKPGIQYYYEYNFPQDTIDKTYNFVAGHKYQILSGQAIVDLGTFGTTVVTPPVPAGPIVKATEYVNDIVSSAGYSIRVQNIQNDYFKQITTAGYTGTISFDMEIRCAAPLSFSGISTFRITDIVNRNHLDLHMPNDATFTLENGKTYRFENYKVPTDVNEIHTQTPQPVVKTLSDEVNELTFTNITYSATGNIAENSLTASMLTGLPTLPTGVTITSIKNQAISTSGTYHLELTFTKGSESATKNIDVVVTITRTNEGSTTQSDITIKASDYESIDYSTIQLSGAKVIDFYNLSGDSVNAFMSLNPNSDLNNPNKLQVPLIVDIKESGNLLNITWIRFGYFDGTSHHYIRCNLHGTLNTTLQGGHKYKFVYGQDPEDLGAY